MKFQIIDLFSGIGGFSYAGHAVGWDTVVTCEINDFCNTVLKYHFPNAYHHTDIKTLNYETIIKNSRWNPSGATIAVGGFPCQGFSVAGKRKGKEDDRYLWPEYLRIIQETRPDWVLGENVTGIISLALDEVLADLENEGYACQTLIIPDAGVGAPHKRDRVWIIANRRTKTMRESQECVNKHRFTTNTRLQRPSGSKQQTAGIEQCSEGLAPDTDIRIGSQHGLCSGREMFEGAIKEGGINPDTKCKGLQKSEQSEQPEPVLDAERKDSQYATDTQSSRMERSRANRKQEPQSQIRAGLSGCNSTRNGWSDWPTQSPLCSRNDELSSRLDGITFPKWRNESIKAYGNSIVPQIPYIIFSYINSLYDEQTNQSEDQP